MSLTQLDHIAKAECLEDVQKLRIWLMTEQPFMAALALYYELRPVVDCRIRTAATDGKRLYFNPYFMKGLSDDHRRFVFAHEVWHGALNHGLRRVDRDPRVWNLACDHEVNRILAEANMTAPKGAIHFRWLQKHDAEYAYDQLINQGERLTLSEITDDAGQHIGDIEPVPNQEESGPDDGSTDPPPSKSVFGPIDRKIDPDFAPVSFDEPESGSQQQRIWRQRIVAAAQQLGHSQIIGGGSGHLSRIIQDLVEPTIHWTHYLRRFVTNLFSGQRNWLPPSRRHVHRGIYLPSIRTKELNIVVVIDTSASTLPFLKQFISELVAIANSYGRYRIRLIQCDYQIVSDIEYTDCTPIDQDSFEIFGIGGTCFMPVFQAVALQREPPRALIYFTDGFGQAPTEPPPYPVLWALTPGGVAPATWGQVVRLGD